jgi:hypothetical protein
VPLAATHHLRNAINNGKAPEKEVLANYEIPIVASVLKLYLLELPGMFPVGMILQKISDLDRFDRVFSKV